MPCKLTWRPSQYKVRISVTLIRLYYVYTPKFPLDPALVIVLNATRIVVLDVSPYNLISLACNVTQPQPVNIVKSISWKRTSPSGTVQTLSHDGIATNVTNTGLVDPSSTSELSLYATSDERWRYTCSASIQVPGDPIISYEQTVEVIVKGEYCSEK